MKFSVVVPLFNKAAYIEQTLKSVQNQSLTDFEILVIDDGSTDQGADSVERMQDSRIRLVRQKNAGVSAARNHGISLALGEWVAFLDADDWWHPEYLSVQAATIAAYPTRDMVATAILSIPDAPDWNPGVWSLPAAGGERLEIEDLPQRWLQGHPFFTGSVAVRRRLLDGMQPCFAVGENDGEDLELWLRIAENKPLVWCAVPMVAYRDAVAGSLSKGHLHKELPPYLKRLAIRAASGDMEPVRARSALIFITQQKISFARRNLISGQRLSAFQWIIKSAVAGFGLKRWWVTLGMGLFVPAGAVACWQKSKKNKVGASTRKMLTETSTRSSSQHLP